MLHFFFFMVKIMWSNISDLKKAFKNLNTNLLDSSYHTDAVEIINWLRENLYHNTATTETYRQAIMRFYLWLSKYRNINLHNCNRNNIIEYIEFIKNIPYDWQGKFQPLEQDSWRPFSRIKLSQRTINYSIQLIHQLFTYLHQVGYINKNPLALPIKKISQIREVDTEKYFTLPECLTIYRYILLLPESTKVRKELKNRAIWIFKLLAYTGCRKSEVLYANMDSFIIKNGFLWLKVIGKGNKFGSVPVVPQLEDALNSYRAYYGLPEIRNKSQTEKHIPLIIKKSTNGEYENISKGVINHQLKKICSELASKISDYEFATKLNKVSAHWFRHTAATIQANSGVDIRIVQKNLRHSSIQTTIHYQHTDQNYQHCETSEKFNLKLS